MQTKSLAVQPSEDGPPMTAIALFARTDGSVDKDFDLTLPGAFPDVVVPVSDWAHSSATGATMPVGTAQVTSDEKAAYATITYFSNDAGRAAYSVLKGLWEAIGPKGAEFSYAYNVLDDDTSRAATLPYGADVRRILKRVQPLEISPVLVGAGVDTAILAVKARLAEPDLADIQNNLVLTELRLHLLKAEEVLQETGYWYEEVDRKETSLRANEIVAETMKAAMIDLGLTQPFRLHWIREYTGTGRPPVIKRAQRVDGLVTARRDVYIDIDIAENDRQLISILAHELKHLQQFEHGITGQAREEQAGLFGIEFLNRSYQRIVMGVDGTDARY